MTGCLHPSPADNVFILASIQLAELRRNGATLSLACCAMEPEHLLHSMVTCPLSANTWRLKSKHPFVPIAQQLICSSDKNMHVVLWADHQWNAGVGGQPHKTLHFHPRHQHPPRMTLPRSVRVWINRLRTGVEHFCSLYRWGMSSSAACECGAEE